ncbi:ribosome biogenesis protein BRX1 homolog [Saccoglossus kowalevskii]|uniref:Ribosome biogenesis protein BRX1 homolog n=1 Tax=Saccoglossus kowalevskii TaxID=10224 RepID=A0ABM0H0S2_SACKO|nr:PREDICTED: ribosome biogenesis protein BRX1 homolog [Saccoglossus kowalevskii]
MAKRKGTTEQSQNKVKKLKKSRSLSKKVPRERNSTSTSTEGLLKKRKWINKTRVLIFCSRGISYRGRHLMNDLRRLMPHSKPDVKMEKKDGLFLVNEICEIKNCNKVIYFEAKKKKDLYMWIANSPNGPSAKFLIENLHTMDELKMTGNCLKGSRPILSFDSSFGGEPHYALLKEVFTQIFSTPYHHPKSQPFVDHVYTFSVGDNRIWFRNYQIVEEDGSLAEVGPRFVLNLIKIFGGSFIGPTLYENPHYKSPNEQRRDLKREASLRYQNRIQSKAVLDQRREQSKDTSYKMDTTDEVFFTIKPEDAEGLAKSTFYRKK